MTNMPIWKNSGYKTQICRPHGVFGPWIVVAIWAGVNPITSCSALVFKIRSWFMAGGLFSYYVQTRRNSKRISHKVRDKKFNFSWDVEPKHNAYHYFTHLLTIFSFMIYLYINFQGFKKLSDTKKYTVGTVGRTKRNFLI